MMHGHHRRLGGGFSGRRLGEPSGADGGSSSSSSSSNNGAAPAGTYANAGKRASPNAQAVVAFGGAAFAPQDIASYLDVYHPSGLPQPTVARAVGNGPLPPNVAAGGGHADCSATLGLELALALAPQVPTWFWSVGPGQEPPPAVPLPLGPGGKSVAPTPSPLYDPAVAVTLDKASGGGDPFLEYLLQLHAAKAPPLVHSVTYSEDEASLDAGYTRRVSLELAKCGLRGLSMLFASGSDGVGGRAQRRLAAECRRFAPQFPATSPYVTAVGGTAFKRVPAGTEAVGNLAEVVADASAGIAFTSGGGFSNRFARPSWQHGEVNRYIG
jgi:hypothetical protein